MEACAKTHLETLGNFIPYNLYSSNKAIPQFLLLNFYIPYNSVDLNLIFLIDKGAMSNYMSYDTAFKLGLDLEKDNDVILAMEPISPLT